MPADPVTAVLVHSPFLGPASLRPLADALAALGHPTVLPDLRPSLVAPPVHQRLIGAFADALADAVAGPVVLVGHSGAGPLLPAFAEELEDNTQALLYLDAELPTPGRSRRDTLGEPRYATLHALTREGHLPRWQHWWGGDALTDLIPDPHLRTEMADESPEVPIAFLKEPRPITEWEGPWGYVQLSAAYPEAVSKARAANVPVHTLDRHHLAMATDPEPVAQAVLTVLQALTPPH